MSDFNPLTGQAPSAPTEAPREAGPRLNFEDPMAQKMDQMVQSDEAAEFAKLARLASKTKFATGNLEIDIRNYMKMKRIGAEIAGMMSNDEA